MSAVALVASPTRQGIAQRNPIAPCCAITAIDVKTGIITAKINANGNLFTFKVTDAKTSLSAFRIGQAVNANFATHQVSVNPVAPCCAIISGPNAAIGRAGGVAILAGAGRTAFPPKPTVGFGAPQPYTGASRPVGLGLASWSARTVDAVVNGKRNSAQLVHVRGVAGIRQAQGIPEGARRLLEMHARTLRPGESNHYMINPELAADWIRAHPVPDDIKATDTSHDDDCDWYSSTSCLEQTATDAWRHAWDQAVKDWDHASDELSRQWNYLQACFADSTLRLPEIPVQFSIAPTMTVGLERSGSTTVAGADVSGTVSGTLGLGFPMETRDFKAQVDVFYIPCLPFAVRPRSIAASGTLTVGEQLKASVKATGKFDKLFTIPPTGGPQIPIYVVPIVIGDVPVAELDISAYIEGNVEVGGSGSAEGTFQFDNPNSVWFNFACSGQGCSGGSHPVPVPTTTTETATISGNVFVKPAIYTALQLDFDVDAFTARAGPQPYLLGTATGCDNATATQTVGGQGGSTTAENHILAADLDWGVDLRAEALIARQAIGKPWIDSTHLTGGKKHLFFRDLLSGGSTALIATVTGPATVSVGKPAVLKVKMPRCYPYTERVKYRVAWTGAASPASHPNCQWQASQGTCSFDPTKDLALTFMWSAAGSYSVSVVPVSDDHQRAFSPEPKPGIANVTVAAATGAP